MKHKKICFSYMGRKYKGEILDKILVNAYTKYLVYVIFDLEDTHIVTEENKIKIVDPSDIFSVE